MKEEFSRSLRCPGCRGERLALEVFEQDVREVRHGELRCTACGSRYQITNGVPDLLPQEDEVVAREIAGWLKLAGPLDDDLIPTMAALPYYPHDPWLYMAPDFVQAFELISFAGRRVLDLGAGRSWSSRHILKVGQAREVVALDILRQKYIGLETADLYMEMDHIHFERVLGSMHDMPFKDREFDVVFSAATVHHSSDLDALFAEIGRVLRPGGVFLMIAEPSKRRSIPENRPDNAETQAGINEHVYALGEYLRPLRRHGFRPRVAVPRSIFYRLTYPDDAFTAAIPRPLRGLPPTFRCHLAHALLAFRPTRHLVYRYWSLPLSVVARKPR
jgi:SAM-dependent methyltransferase